MAMSPETSNVGFVGLGNLGLPMAHSLIDAGWSLTVMDRSTSKTDSCVEAGARRAESIVDLADVDVLVLVVSDDAAVESLLLGGDGFFENGGANRTVIVHSTLLPETAERLGVLAREHGAGLLDAPVSGGAARAREGDLTIMVGGEQAVLDEARPILDTVGSTVLHVGKAGAGAATKLANQLMMLSALAGVHEALDLAGAYGVPVETVLESVSTGTGDSWVARHWGFFDETARAYADGGTPVAERPWSKDLFEVVAAARAADVRVPVAALLSQTLADRVESHAAAANARTTSPSTKKALP